MGVSPGCGGNELDRNLRNGLDDEGLHRRLARPALREPVRSRWSNFSASTTWFHDVGGFLVHPVLDVPEKDLCEDMSESQTVRTELNLRQCAGSETPSRLNREYEQGIPLSAPEARV